MATYSPHPSSREEPGLLGSLERLYRRRWLAAGLWIGVLAAAAAFAAALPPLYRAGATLLVQHPVADAYMPQAGLGATEARLQAINRVALSRDRLLSLADRFDLHPELRERGATDELLARLQRDINVEPVSATAASGRPTTVAFTVSYIGEDPETAADVANALSSFYIAQNDRMRLQQTSRTTEVLEQQLEETRQKLDSQLAQLQSRASRTGGALPQQVDANLLAINRIDGQVRANAAERSRRLERRQTLQNELADLAANTDGEAADPALRLAGMKANLVQMRGRLSDRHPDVRQLQADIETLERQLEATGSNGSANDPANGSAASASSPRAVLEAALAETNAGLDRLDEEDASLRSELAQYEGRVTRAATGAPALQSLTRDLESTREQHDALQRRYNEARLAARAESGSGPEEFALLDPAVTPLIAAGPNRQYVLLLGLIVGVLLAFGGAALADRLDTSFHSVDDLRAFTSVPVLASIPKVTTNRDRVGRMARGGTAAGMALLVIAVIAAGAFQIGARSEDIVRLLMRFS